MNACRFVDAPSGNAGGLLLLLMFVGSESENLCPGTKGVERKGESVDPGNRGAEDKAAVFFELGRGVF